MEIRALTGFDLQTREQYGRSYSPLSGCSPALGAISGNPTSKKFSTQYTIPSYIPPQKIEMEDPVTGKKKWLTVANINELVSLLERGQKMIKNPTGGTGTKVIHVNPSKVNSSTSISTKEVLIYGGLAAAIIAIALIMKNK